MALTKLLLGLDLGSHSLKSALLSEGLRQIERIEVGLCPRPRDPSAAGDALSRLLQGPAAGAEFRIAALPGDRITSRHLRFPFGDARRLRAAVPFALEEELPFDLAESALAWQRISHPGDPGEVIASVCARAEVAGLLESLQAAGAEPRILEAEGLVLANLSQAFELQGSRLLVDLGHRKSVLCRMLDGRAVGARCLPLGGMQLDQTLARDRSLTVEEAAAIKREESLFGPAASRHPQTGALLDRLASEILRALAMQDERPQARAIEEITLCGGGALLDGIEAELARRCGFPVARLGEPRAPFAAAFAALEPRLLHAPALALALRGSRNGQPGLDFRQGEFGFRTDWGVLRREFRVSTALAAGALALLLTNVASSHFIARRQTRALETRSAVLFREAFPDEPLPPDPLQVLSDRLAQAGQRAERLGVYHGNLSALDLLTELSRNVPADLAVAFEEVRIDGPTIRMQVQAKDFQAADRLQAALARFAAFSNARVGSTERDEKRGTVRFGVDITLPGQRG